MAKAPAPYTAKQFFLEDYGRTLFPLSTNKVLVQHGDERIQAHIQGLLADNRPFLPQKRVYAAKDALHLRRTVKLDPVAEFFIYDLVYRNRALFRRPHAKNKRHFGYRFEDGKPVPASRSYSEFKIDVTIENALSSYFIGFDIASYFNSVYHHDLVDWFSNQGASEEDSQAFGRFLREANAGRTLDCLPHGLYPTKMIGNDFLRFVEESHRLKSETIIRFMDDFYMFSDSEEHLRSDFAEIQRILGQKGLSVNPGKTTTLTPRSAKTEADVDDLKKRLLQRRRKIVSSSFYDDDEGAEIELELALSEEELTYITSLLSESDLDEDDAELILTVMRHHTEDVEEHLPAIARRFPHLAKNIYRFCSEIADREMVADMVLDIARAGAIAQEYQLFWFGMMLEDYLISTSKASEIIGALFNHPNATDISRAKILEIADVRYGLPDLRNGYLSSGQSDWLSWSSAVGSRTMSRAGRNYRLGYFMNSSDMNRLIGGIVEAI